jgi:hypothetical protein
MEERYHEKKYSECDHCRIDRDQCGSHGNYVFRNATHFSKNKQFNYAGCICSQSGTGG